MLSETDKAWMAGFMDGEGYLAILKQVRKRRPSPTYRPYVKVSNTRREVPTLFQDEYGGAIYVHHEERKDKSGLKWSDAYNWYCPISSTKRLLLDTLNYFKLKRGQAELILQFLDKRRTFARRERYGRFGSAGFSEDEIKFREGLRMQIRALNSKGYYARHVSLGERNENGT